MRTIRKHTNRKSVKQTSRAELIYPELSYQITGVLFETHNEKGRYAREKQYGDFIEKRLRELGIPYEREVQLGDSGNVVDFLIENKIVLELKSKTVLTKQDYFQLQRYLQESGIKLGILANFRYKYLKPIRVVRIDTENSQKYKKSFD